jgi:hypothetical protein
MAGAVTISGNITGLPQGSVTIGPLTLTPADENLYEELTILFASGANTIAVPPWSEFCLIQPGTGSVIALTLKGVTGDTGIPIGLSKPTLLSFVDDATPASFVITAASSFSAYSSISFF